MTEQGTFEHGTSVLQRRSATRSRRGERLDRIRGALLAARDGRPPRPRDDKVVAAWNGMAIGALAEAGAAFDRPDLDPRRLRIARVAGFPALSATARLATGPRGTAWPGASAGLLEDYAYVAAGLLALYGVTGGRPLGAGRRRAARHGAVRVQRRVRGLLRRAPPTASG